MKTPTTHFSLIRYTYDENGFLVKVSYYTGPNDTLEYERYHAYDSNGNCIKTWYSSNNDVIYDLYDSNNRRIFKYVSDDYGKTTLSYEYDNKGRVIKDIMDESVTDYTYDDNDNIINMKCSDGTGESYEFDDHGNMIRRSSESGYVVNMYNEYDDKGRLICCKCDDTLHGITMFNYDEHDRVIRTTDISDCNRTSTNIEYDIFGNIITKMIIFDNTRIVFIIYIYNYDNGNRLMAEKTVDITYINIDCDVNCNVIK